MKRKRKRGGSMMPRRKESGKLEARLCVDYSEKGSFKAINILRKAGYKVTATPASGIVEPELSFESNSYNGISEIREFVKNNKKK